MVTRELPHLDRRSCEVNSWKEMLLVGMDTETTGLSTEEDRIFEIALVSYQNGSLVETYSELIDPIKKLPPVVEEKTGVKNEDVQGKPVFAHFASDIERRLRDQVIVGYNILEFDLMILQAEFNRLEMELPPMKVIDVLVFTRHLVKTSRHNLGEMIKHFGLEMDTAHRADADASATVRLLLAMAGDLPSDLDSLLMLQSQWQDEFRQKKAMWRSKPGDDRPSALLRQDLSSRNALMDSQGRVTLGPGYIYGEEKDPLKAYLTAYFASTVLKNN